MKPKNSFLFLLKLNTGLFLILIGLLQTAYAFVNQPHAMMPSQPVPYFPVFAAACVLGGAYLVSNVKGIE
ncbi:hypothetical protein GFS24_05680 [Chitinophaga sp. SYP-B3965]|uniref:hypothetical protein n=1 Tax=Chitinophaga sp. SYP-B3965 TaxID=2663120 RepID=UPI00129973A1|nr:hypothetical protein [Chitinophaga sp. SYP-B3965]MRG44592.1 hypothetical protein [Chitinophaga sp. SYP-B3965]